MARPFFSGDEFDFSEMASYGVSSDSNVVAIVGQTVKAISEGNAAVSLYDGLGAKIVAFNVVVIDPSRPVDYLPGLGKRNRVLKFKTFDNLLKTFKVIVLGDNPVSNVESFSAYYDDANSAIVVEWDNVDMNRTINGLPFTQMAVIVRDINYDLNVYELIQVSQENNSGSKSYPITKIIGEYEVQLGAANANGDWTDANLLNERLAFTEQLNYSSPANNTIRVSWNNYDTTRLISGLPSTKVIVELADLNIVDYITIDPLNPTGFKDYTVPGAVHTVYIYGTNDQDDWESLFENEAFDVEPVPQFTFGTDNNNELVVNWSNLTPFIIPEAEFSPEEIYDGLRFVLLSEPDGNLLTPITNLSATPATGSQTFSGIAAGPARIIIHRYGESYGTKASVTFNIVIKG